MLLEHRNHRTQSSGLHSDSKKETFRETLLAGGPLSAQTRGLPREHLSPSVGVLLAQGTSSQGRRARVPPCGRRAGGGPGSYCGGASLPDRARDTHTDEIVALKKVRMDKEKDGELGGAAAPLALKWEGLGRQCSGQGLDCPLGLMWNGKKGSPPTHTHTPTPTVDSLVTRNGPRNKNQTNQRSPDDSP